MPEVIKIEGEHLLEGEVTISGAKNATVALIPATVLANGPVTIVGIPQIADVESLVEILRILNVEVQQFEDDHIVIDPSHMKNAVLDQEVVTKLRASYYFMGALLGKYGKVKMKMPGGCHLGPRPIDLHLKGFEALGAKVSYAKNCYTIEADELIGSKIFLDKNSIYWKIYDFEVAAPSGPADRTAAPGRRKVPTLGHIRSQRWGIYGPNVGACSVPTLGLMRSQRWRLLTGTVPSNSLTLTKWHRRPSRSNTPATTSARS